MTMHEDDQDPFDTYAVVINHEEQYSIWPTEKTLPDGWRAAGKEGLKADCLAYIDEHWTDMRPLSLRRQMEEWEKNPPAPVPAPGIDAGPSLVDRLCDGEHPLMFNCRPERSADALKARIDLGYVHLKFPQTNGGTELGVRLDPGASDWSRADFAQRTGEVTLVGALTLDYVPVRCVATIDIATLEGTGHLDRLDGGAAQ